MLKMMITTKLASFVEISEHVSTDRSFFKLIDEKEQIVEWERTSQDDSLFPGSTSYVFAC